MTSDSLSNLSIRALKWNYVGVGLKALLQLSVGVFLARQLGPQAFGLFSAVLLLIGLMNIVAELGLGAALTQKETVTEPDVRAAFTRVMLVGLSLAGLVAVSGRPLASLFGRPELAPFMSASAGPIALQSLGVVSLSMLRRNLEQRAVQLCQLGSYLLGYLGVGLIMAVQGYGAWSLLAAFSAQTLLFSLSLYARVRHSVVPLFRYDSAFFRSFGSRAVFSNITNWLIENVDNLLVGKLFGMNALGTYAIAYNLVRTPINQVVVSVQSVLFAASARAQHQEEALRRAFVATAGGLSLLLMPIFFSVASVAPTIVLALYGERWLDAIPLLAPLALAMPIHALMAIAGPFLWGKGLVGKELQVQLAVAVLLSVVILITANLSLGALAWGVLLVYAVRALWMIAAVSKALRLDWVRLWRSIRGGVLLGAFVSTALWSTDHGLAGWDTPPFARLCADIGLGMALTLGAGLRFRRALSSPDTLWMYDRFVSRMPAPLRMFALQSSPE